jgi:methionine biosynthesis protein MetW
MDTNEYNKKFYSNIFGREADRYYKIQERKIKIVLSFLENREKSRILDIGCADGFISSVIAKETGAKVYGIDISKTSISKAIKKGIEAKVVNVDKEKFPFKDNSFDAIFCGDVLEHVYDTESVLRGINRILKKEGYVIISVPNIASWYNRGFLFLGFMPTWVESSLRTYTGNPFIKEGVGHIHAFTKRSLNDLLEINGFRVERSKGSPVLADGSRKKWEEKIWNAVDSTFARKTTLASTIIIKARKVREMNKNEERLKI